MKACAEQAAVVYAHLLPPADALQELIIYADLNLDCVQAALSLMPHWAASCMQDERVGDRLEYPAVMAFVLFLDSWMQISEREHLDLHWGHLRRMPSSACKQSLPKMLRLMRLRAAEPWSKRLQI